MKAKDTVITGWQMTEPITAMAIHDLLLQQAEISFRAGMQEVADWMDNNKKFILDPAMMRIFEERWHCFLEEKKNGIHNGYRSSH